MQYADSDNSAVDRNVMIANILATYDAASDSQRIRGERWYPRMTALATGRALRLGVTVHATAGVYSSHSTNTPWQRNLALAAAHLRGERARCERTLGANVRRADRCLAGEHIADTLAPKSKARKVVSFAANIAGDYDAVTVDRWALRIAYGTPDGYVPEGDEYDSIAYAYTLAAALRDVSPATMQAVTWVVAREREA